MNNKLKIILILIVVSMCILLVFSGILGNDFTSDIRNQYTALVDKFSGSKKVDSHPSNDTGGHIENGDAEIFKQIDKYATVNLRMRSGPSTDYDIISTIPNGEKVQIIGHKDGWDEITYNGERGYSSVQYLSETNPMQVGDEVEVIESNETLKIVNGILLVNKTYALPMDYNPGADPEAKAQLDKMFEVAKEQIGKTLTAFSGYRTYEYQKGLFNRYVEKEGYDAASMYSAKPRHSEHETGLAYDIGGPDQKYWLKSSFEETEEGIWLKENAHKFGYILRYPNGKTDITEYIYEPWHFRYIGIADATIVYENDLTLEEYLLEDN